MSCFNRCGHRARRAGSFSPLSGCFAFGVALFVYALVGSSSLTLHAGQSRTVAQGLYTEGQANRGQAIYKDRCSSCHGATLGGGLAPPLAGDVFLRRREKQSLLDLADKIQNTMPANDPGQLTRQQAVDIVAHIIQVGKFPAGKAELTADEGALKQITWPAGKGAQPVQIASTAAQMFSSPPPANLAQMMRGMLFPTSNLIFNVQNQDPGAQKTGWVPGKTAFSWADWGAGIYSGWEMVDYAAMALAESAPLVLMPGRYCENGKLAPVERPEWVKFSLELAEAGRAAYKASQSRKQDAVAEVTNQIADACLHCHEVYRDKPGGSAGDPSNKAARCVP